MSRILCLDLGTTTGWAMRDHGVVMHGTNRFENGRHSGGGMRFLRFGQWLHGLDRIDAVYYEEVRRHLGVDAAHCYGGFWAVLTGWAEQQAIPYAGISVGTIKRSWTGKGNSDKSVMIAEARRRGYADVKDDNEADALALLHYVESCHAQGLAA